MLPPDYIKKIVRFAIEEDVGEGDITADLLSETKQVVAKIITREQAIICGCDFVAEVFQQLSRAIHIEWHVKDGDLAKPNDVLCELKGSVKPLLTGERIALNFLQTLSGTATITQQYVEKLKGSRTQLLDTRKTLPGLRLAQKYAVTCGGGRNHRMGLFDAFLIKENHIAASGSIAEAIAQAKSQHPGKIVEVEVENLQQLEEALIAGAEIIMLDNFNLPAMQQAVILTSGRSKLEVSGNITLDQLATIAATGVDFISVGSLTKHVQAIDLSMRVV